MKKILELNLVVQILIGMVCGLILAIFRNTLLVDSQIFGPLLDTISIFGTMFTGALKAVAPILVFVLIINTIASHQGGSYSKIGSILKLYLVATIFAALIAVAVSFIHPVTMTLPGVSEDIASAPSSLVDVFTELLNNIVDNPINALATANYLGVLSWAVLLGIMLKSASTSTKQLFSDLSDAISKVVKLIISFAPLGIMGLLYVSITADGIKGIASYGAVLGNLLIALFVLAFILNPLITYVYIRENPYPLVLRCLRESGITAFFTRSSAANIPVNIALAKDLDIDSELYNLSIPLGSTINMGGAAITITTLTLAAAFSTGIEVTIPMAILLSIVAALSACGSSGVSGGSLLLIPLACGLFGIGPDIAEKVVGVGFVISVIQDSCETGLNSSSDILYTAIVDMRAKRLNK